MDVRASISFQPVELWKSLYLVDYIGTIFLNILPYPFQKFGYWKPLGPDTIDKHIVKLY